MTVINILLIFLLLQEISSLLEYNYSIAILHMRKAAGSQILGFVTDWLRSNDCFLHQELYISTAGIANGKSRQGPNEKIKLETLLNLTALPAPCPFVNVVHEEFATLDGKLLRNVFNKSLNRQLNISFITSLRHPIERIGSQAFYGPNNIVYNSFKLSFLNQCNQSISEREIYKSFKNCINLSRNYKKRKFCLCFLKAKQIVIEQLHTNNTIWFDWMDKEIGFHDVYLPNYYIHRLTAYQMNPHDIKLFSKARECLEYHHLCSADLIDGYYRLKKIFRAGFVYDHKYLKSPVTPQVLELAKILIRDVFHVVILEKINHPYTNTILSTALFDLYHPQYNKKNISKIIGRNRGSFSDLGITNYTDFMPPKV